MSQSHENFKNFCGDTIVELHHGFFWDCNKCGKESFIRSLVPDLAPEEIEYIKIMHNIEDEEIPASFIVPDTVTCRECKATYFTQIQQFGS